jgi:hypothetical protein
LYAPDAVIAGADGTTMTGSGAIGAAASSGAASSLKVERVAPVTVEGDLSATFVRLTDATGWDVTVLTVLQTKDDKIVRHWDIEDGLTPPLDNAVTP